MLRKLLLLCMFMFCSFCFAQDAEQITWYPVSSSEIQELNRIYKNSQSSREQALLQVQKLQGNLKNLQESLNLEKAQTNNISTSFQSYKTEAQSALNTQAQALAETQQNLQKAKLKIQKLITAIAIESSLIAIAVILMLLKIKKLVPF